jgi:EmrB/QacA subfamily drug resistance transporter
MREGSMKLTETNRKWWTLAAVSFSLFMIMLDTTVVNVALESIRDDFAVDIAKLEWVVNAYTLAYAVLLLLGGKLADLLGRRLIFMIGLTIFTGSSLLCGLAWNADVLVAARGIQGLGAAFMLPATLAIITQSFEPHERGAAFGIWAGASGLGLALGPLIGGLIVEQADWRWIFYVNVPIGIAALGAARIIIPESRDPSEERRFDVPGLVTSGVALIALTYALIEANSEGWGSALIISLFVVSAVFFAAFLLIEARQRLPMVDLNLFRNTTFLTANIVAMLVFGYAVAVLFVMSLYLQIVLGYSPLKTGACFLPLTLMLLPVSPAAGKLTDRIGARWPMAVGIALMGLMLVLLAGADEGSSFGDFVLPFILGGIGFAATMAPNTAAVLGSVDPAKAGIASGLLNTFRQVGAVLGIAIGGALLNRHITGLVPGSPQFKSNYVDGMQEVFILGAIVMFIAALATVAFIRRHRPIGSVEAAGAPV